MDREGIRILRYVKDGTCKMRGFPHIYMVFPRGTRPNHATTGFLFWRVDHTRGFRQDICMFAWEVVDGPDDWRQNETIAQTQNDEIEHGLAFLE